MIGSWNVIRNVVPREWPGAIRYFIDNFTMGGKAKLISEEAMIGKINYPSAKVLTDMFNKEVTRLYENPELCKKLYGNIITPKQYKGFTN
jgi:hypothetical protein